MTVRIAAFGPLAVLLGGALGRTSPVHADMPPAKGDGSAHKHAVQIDLRPALQTNLLTESILDEGVWVLAERDKTFLTVPLVYDPRAANLTLSKSTLRGKDARFLLGIRVLVVKEHTSPLDHQDNAVLYEKLEIGGRASSDHGDESSSPTLMARNTAGPRKKEGDKSNRFKPTNDTLPANGLAALVFEVAKSAKRLSIDVGDGEEIIDLEIVRNANRPIPFENTPDDTIASIPPAVKELVSLVGEGSSSMAALAVDLLARDRSSWTQEQDAEWVAGIDPAVLSAATREEPVVRSSIWRYFAGRAMFGRPSPWLTLRALDILAAADDDFHRQCIKMIACGLALRECHPVWKRPLCQDGPGDSGAASAMTMLGTILHSEDEGVCQETVRVLARLPAERIDWKSLADASPIAQKLAIRAFEESKNTAAAKNLFRTLLAAPNLSNGEMLARLARQLELRIESVDDPIFLAWDKAATPEDKAAILNILSGLDLGPLIYSDRLAGIVRSAALDLTSDKPTEKTLREAAWTLMLTQSQRTEPKSPSSQRADSKKPAQRPHGSFPMLVSRTARDPVVMTLADAARRAPRNIRAQALAALLRQGLAEEAVRALTDPATTAGQRELLLKELSAKDAAGIGQDAFVAMLGLMLRKECAANAPSILARLREIKTQTQEHEQWRLAAAIKAGLNFFDLDQLAMALDPPTAKDALAWLHELGHMSPQDQQRLAAATKPDDRSAILDRIDFRRGQLVDGRYGVLAVIETLEGPRPPDQQGDGSAPGRPRSALFWREVRRRTIVLPPLTIDSSEESTPNGQHGFRVVWNDKPLGEGLLMNKPKSVGGPGRFSPALLAAPWQDLFAGRQIEPTLSDTSIGPLVLQHRAVANPLSPGTINLDIADYLRQALAQQKVFPAKERDALVPKPFAITLRYASFGSYYGCAPETPPSDSPAVPPRRILLNVLVILEKME